jgi:hypothetical protein
MIQVTLSFNSIAAAVAELSKIDPAALSATHATEVVTKEPQVGKPAPATQAKPAAGKTTAKAADAPASTASAPAPVAAQSAETAQPASTAAEAPPIDYALLKAAVFELSGKNQPKVAEIAAAFGVKTFKDLAPAKWADALAAVKAALAPAAVEAEDAAFA